MTLGLRPTYALRTILVITLGAAFVACGIPWRNLQNGSHADAARSDATRDGAADVPVSMDALGDSNDAVATDAADVTSADHSMDVVVAIDTPTIDVLDTSLSPDVRDTSIAPDVTDVADTSDVPSGCYGVSSSCSASAPCCAGLTCTGGTCTSSCLTYAATCPAGGCCAGLTCMFGFCMAATCQTPHESCAGSNACCVGLACEGGVCVCPIGMASCHAAGIDYCADLNTNTRNCGACGHRCGGGQMCVAGTCL